MSRPDEADRIDQLAADLDDLQTIADEITEEPPEGVDPKTVKKLKNALDKAVVAADDLENKTK
jgi:Fe-S-cluster formation regulator IscX/YfhJ